MTDQQSTAIRTVLAAAPDAALRRVVRQPLRLWKAGGMIRGNPCRCLIQTLENLGAYSRMTQLPATSWSEIPECERAFDAACAADGLRETVAVCKRWARELLRERGGG